MTTCSECKGKGFVELFSSCSPCSCRQNKQVIKLPSGNTYVADFEKAYETLEFISRKYEKAFKFPPDPWTLLNSVFDISKLLTMADRSFVLNEYLNWKEQKEKDDK